MTAYDPQSGSSTYQPPVKKSSRTLAWGIGRAIVWLVYAFALIAIVIATIAFVLQLFGADPSQRIRAMDLPQRQPRHRTLPRHLPDACQRQLGCRRVTALRDHHVRAVRVARERAYRLHRPSTRQIHQPGSLRRTASCAPSPGTPVVIARASGDRGREEAPVMGTTRTRPVSARIVVGLVVAIAFADVVANVLTPESARVPVKVGDPRRARGLGSSPDRTQLGRARARARAPPGRSAPRRIRGGRRRRSHRRARRGSEHTFVVRACVTSRPRPRPTRSSCCW